MIIYECFFFKNTSLFFENTRGRKQSDDNDKSITYFATNLPFPALHPNCRTPLTYQSLKTAKEASSGGKGRENSKINQSTPMYFYLFIYFFLSLRVSPSSSTHPPIHPSIYLSTLPATTRLSKERQPKNGKNSSKRGL